MQNTKNIKNRITRIALLGIDGSGKSTISKEMKRFLSEKGYEIKIIPFHKWVFVDKLRGVFGFIDKGRKDRKSPYQPKKNSLSAIVKPPVAFLDNILFYKINSPRKPNQIYIYDRFICATQIKMDAMNYANKWFRKLWISFKPDFAFIFDVDPTQSVIRQTERKDDYAYPKEILEKERRQYLDYAQKYNFPIIPSITIEETRKLVLEILDTKY